MVSFVCDTCQETCKKPALDGHAQRCRNAVFSCIDCYKTFKGTEYRQHFSCITEKEKYEKNKPEQKINQKSQNEKRPAEVITPVELAKKTKVEMDLNAIKSVLETAKESVSLKTLKKSLKNDHSLSKKEIKKFLESNITFNLSKKGEISIILN